MQTSEQNGAGRAWTAGEEDQLKKLWHAGYTTREIAARLGRTWKAVKLKRFSLGLTPRMPQNDRGDESSSLPISEVTSLPVKLDEDFLNDAREHLWHRDRQLLHREKTQEARRLVFEERFLELLENRLPYWRPGKNLTVADTSKVKRSDLSAVLLLSDSHVGQQFDPRETDGHSAYSPRIFLSRLNFLAGRILDMASMIPSRELHILCLGDLLHGALNHGAEREETLLLVDQFSLCVHAFHSFFLRLTEAFPLIIVRSVSGNHGRWPHQKKMPSVARESNLDAFVVRAVEMACRAGGIDRIQFVQSSASRQIADIGGTRVHLLHGDQIRGGDIPHRSMVREATTATFRAVSHGQKPPDLFTMGDKHRAMSLPVGVGEWIVNGSFVSGDQFGQNFAPNRPSQTLFWVSENQGKTLHADIALDAAPLLSAADCQMPSFLHRLL